MKNLSGISLWNFLSVLMFLSCAPAGNISVNNVNDKGSLQEGSFIYALPQTVIDIGVTAEEITIIPGPYEKYAKKYLGIQNVPVKTEKIWNITKIQMQKHLEADADYLYTVSGIIDPDSYPGIARLIKDSLILGAASFSNNQEHLYIYPQKTYTLQYTDLSVKKNFEVEKDVEVSMVMPDTNYVTRPSSARNTLKEKTFEQKAEEAANLLIKLKKRRLKLVAGGLDYMPGGEAMAEALKELSRIEEEYLSLFIGKRIVLEFQRNYQYTPIAGKETDRVLLFRFSPVEGFVDARETSGIPVVLELKAANKTKGLEQYKVPLKPTGGTFNYRIADQASVKLLAGEQLWVEAIYPVFQYGVIVPMNLGK